MQSLSACRRPTKPPGTSLSTNTPSSAHVIDAGDPPPAGLAVPITRRPFVQTL